MLEDDVEADAKSDDEESKEKYQLQEVPGDVPEHRDVNGQGRSSSQHKYKFVPYKKRKL